jgi:fucose permease
VLIGAAIAGFGLAAVYPITISLLSQEFGATASRIGSLMFTMANFGGAFMPWLLGYASNHFGSLRVGMIVPLFASGSMCALYFLKWNSKPTPVPVH